MKRKGHGVWLIDRRKRRRKYVDFRQSIRKVGAPRLEVDHGASVCRMLSEGQIIYVDETLKHGVSFESNDDVGRASAWNRLVTVEEWRGRNKR